MGSVSKLYVDCQRGRRHQEAVEALFEEAGVGMPCEDAEMSEADDAEDSDDDVDDEVVNEITECHGRLDIAFTGLVRTLDVFSFLLEATHNSGVID